MLIDHVVLNIKAGKGGDGVVRWRREKGIPYGGPAGGDGGRGANVYLRVIRDIHALSDYKHKVEWAANDGDSGKKRSMHGSDAEHLYLNIPVGAIVKNRDMDIVYNCETEGEDILILKGGRGGIGNEKFKSATNRAPEEFTRGQIGEYASFDVELRLIADIGIIGYPNAGKSSLLNALTRAGAKTADYAFTTLEPNLGAYHGVILADIPGLIEGASEGKGLGHKFLRHIKRVQSLVHMISSDSEDVVQSYKNIRKELEKFDPELLTKREIIVLSKTDMLDQTDIDKKLKDLKSKLEKASGNKNIFTMSLFDDKSIKDFGTYITKEFGV